MVLNERQRTAVEHYKGPMMVLAGPGSGKTMVITYRTKYLIENYQVDPKNILVITFTKAAADEMKERYLYLMGEKETRVTFGTFHSVFFRILRQYYGYQVRQVLSDDKKYPLILQIIKGLGIDYEDETEYVQSVIHEMSLMKSELIHLEHYHSITCSDYDFKRIVALYEKYKEENNAIDFDDMLCKCYDLLVSKPQVLKRWQEKFQFILVDEFQDINRIQFECLKLLAKPHNHLFIVGDDDQAIYEFRGAKPDFLLNFPKMYEYVKKVILNTNYRSTEAILTASQNVIEHNKQRYEKDLVTPNNKGIRPVIVPCETVEEETSYVIESIEKERERGIQLSEMAIIYRTHIQARFFAERLMDFNIPFYMRDQMSNIFEHWMAKDFIAYLILSQNIKDKEALIRIINKPKRYVSKENLLVAKNYSDNIWEGLYQSYDAQSWMIDRFEELHYHLQQIKGMPPSKSIEYIREVIGYNQYLEAYATYRKMNGEGLLEIADELQESAKPYERLSDWLTHIEAFSQEIKEQQKLRKSDNVLTLTTMHSAKGLEFNTVYLTGCNEGIVPHDKNGDDQGIEEERRLFYVGMTRAKEKLFLTYVKKRFNKAIEPSRFLGEYELPIHQIAVGKKLKHVEFGIGEVIKIKGDILHLQLEQSHKKVKVSLSHCLKRHLLVLL